MLRIHRKGYKRSGYTRRGKRVSGAYVSPTTYLAKDRGKRGRGKAPFPASKVKANILGEGFFDKSLAAQKKRLSAQAKRRGEMAVQGQLQLRSTQFKRTNPVASRRAKVLRKWVAGTFKGRKKVGYPRGFR